MAAPVASVPGANLQAPAWSPGGRELSFEANFHDQKRIELYVGAPREGGFHRVTPRVRPASSLTAGFETVPAGGEVAHELVWSPTAPGVFVYSASTDRHDYDLFLATGAVVAPAPGADGMAAWSPDGRHLAWSSGRSGEGDLYLLSTDATSAEPRRLTSLAGSSELWASWSADGGALAFVAHGQAGDDLWWLPGLEAAPERLVSWTGSQVRPRFSPTGRAVAFYANHEVPDRFDLCVVEPGAEPRVVARGVVPDAHGPAWSPDGRWLVYVADDAPHLDPVRASLVAEPTRTAALELGTVGHGDLALASDGAGGWKLAVVARGLRDDPVRDWLRLFVASVSPPE